MQMKRTILSLVLLLSYSLGFAHNVLPHCSNPDQFSHSHCQTHVHHNEEGLHDIGHEHSAHDNHEDEGFYDFLLCFFSEVDHHYHYELNTDFTFSKISEINLDFLKVKIHAVLTEVQKPRVFESFVSTREVEDSSTYSIPIVGHERHRGPPQMS